MPSPLSVLGDIAKAVAAVLGAVSAVKTFWDFAVGNPGFVTAICAAVFVLVALGGLAYVLLATRPDTNQRVWRFPRWRRPAAVAVVVVTALGIAGAVYGYRVSRPHPTPLSRIGIWVARFDGDPEHGTQRSVGEKLTHFLAGESSLRDIVEVRNLPSEIEGETPRQREEAALAAALRVNATIVIWGTVAGELQQREIYPRVTLAPVVRFQTKTVGGTGGRLDASSEPPFPRTLSLNIVTEETRRHEAFTLSAPPDQLVLAPERVKESLQLARLVLSIMLISRGECEGAQKHLKEFEAQGGAREPLEHAAGALLTGEAYLCPPRLKRTRLDLEASAAAFDIAAARYAAHGHARYAGLARVNGAAARLLLVQMKVDPFDNATRAIERLAGALPTLPADRATNVRSDLGLAYLVRALHTKGSGADLGQAIALLRESGAPPGGREQDLHLRELLGGILLIAARSQSSDRIQHLGDAVAVFAAAAEGFRHHRSWVRYATAVANGGLAAVWLAGAGVDRDENVRRAISAAEQAARVVEENDKLIDFGDARVAIAELSIEIAALGLNTRKFLGDAIGVLRDQAARAQWAAVAERDVRTLYYFGKANVELAERGGPTAAAELAAAALDAGAQAERERAAPTGDVLNQLGRAYLILGRADADNARFELSRQAFEGALKVDPSHAAAKTNLGALLLEMAEAGIDRRSNRRAALGVLQEAVALRKAQLNWDRYALAQNLLGITYLRLADDVSPVAKLKLAVATLEEARDKVRPRTVVHGGILHNLGTAYERNAALGVRPAEHLRRARSAFEEARDVYREQGTQRHLADVDVALGRVLVKQAKSSPERAGLLGAARDAYGEAAQIYASRHPEAAASALLGLREVLCLRMASGVDEPDDRRLLESFSRLGPC